jgi:hypothetical protein
MRPPESIRHKHLLSTRESSFWYTAAEIMTNTDGLFWETCAWRDAFDHAHGPSAVRIGLVVGGPNRTPREIRTTAIHWPASASASTFRGPE